MSAKLIGEDIPKSIGKYNIASERIRTMIPFFATFDGEKWVDIPSFFLNEGGKLYFFED